MRPQATTRGKSSRPKHYLKTLNDASWWTYVMILRGKTPNQWCLDSSTRKNKVIFVINVRKERALSILDRRIAATPQSKQMRLATLPVLLQPLPSLSPLCAFQQRMLCRVNIRRSTKLLRIDGTRLICKLWETK